jgi:hypothetical protein
VSRPLAHLSDEELRARLAAPTAQETQDHPLGLAAVYAWATQFNVYPGRVKAVEGADLYRHFLQAGFSLGPTKCPPWREFGMHLNTLGLGKGRVVTDGRDTRPRLMAKEAAGYFKAWLLQYPRPLDDAPFSDLVRGRDAKATEPEPTE